MQRKTSSRVNLCILTEDTRHHTSTTMHTPAAVFFDLDGTLIDTAGDMGGALNKVLKKYNRPLVSAADYRSSVSHGSIALLKLGFPELNPKTEMQELRLEFLSTYAENVAAESTLFEGVDKLLETLETNNIPWGIITNKPEAPTLDLLNALDLTKRCCSIVGADTTTHAKPHPAPMHLACKRANVTPADCFYVGDAERETYRPDLQLKCKHLWLAGDTSTLKPTRQLRGVPIFTCHNPPIYWLISLLIPHDYGS